MKNIIVCGGDMRNLYLCRSLIERGHRVRWIFAEDICENEDFIDRENHLDSADALILPLPLSRDKKSLNAPLCSEKISLSQLDIKNKFGTVFTSDDSLGDINYFKDEAVTTDNARLTAVGFLKELLLYENEDIMGKKALITGYGRVSQAVSLILSSNMVSVTIAARNENQRHLASSRGLTVSEIDRAQKNIGAYDYVINTVPHALFSAEFFEKQDETTAFFELASSMCDMAKRKPKAYIECKGMPGKHTPKSAGKVIADFVCHKLEE